MQEWKKRLYNNDIVRALYRTPWGRFLYHLPGEMQISLSGQRHPMVPPMWKVYTGRGDFLTIGREFLGHFMELGKLRPQDAFLDVGCGMGRMAVALTSYLDLQGRYEGIEIVSEGVEWCQKRITPRFPNFRFQRADVRNDMYNPKGRHLPEEFIFPFADASFDFVSLTSVFTHMPPAAVKNYLKEISRVLRPGGTCFVTWYLINAESARRVKENHSTLAFKYRLDESSWTLSQRNLEHDVAYDEEWVRRAYAIHGLVPEQPRYGSWCGRPEYLSSQDIIIARKAAG